ncbi:GAF domain-containing sensor histidine kinase [Deinococcus radiophilus]|uniref:Oxygen sensor histidine kinase NreB n=1 Tax=Deinococcus radiophilus TaxID=32062 RepID=A0A431VW88_9DEIO|nr:GAF domain-containing sensor histidine kinase [Deinococcus radiophilus]RTR27512.1 GAF domain-containing protein [Deinococcus radiophilus]UFA50380.1 GAF domain-containing sensor histidine kinase [Deinococcus radiophilus]
MRIGALVGPLTQREQLLKRLLPPLIVVVVLVVELVIAQLRNLQLEFWAHLLFYGFAGPTVTFFALDWIAEGTRARLRAEAELRGLYEQLQRSHGQLQHMQALMRGLTEAGDLSAVVDVAARGARQVSGAAEATVRLNSGLGAAYHDPAQQATHPLTASIPSGGTLALRFAHPPTPEDTALAHSLAAEIGTAVQAAWQRTQDLMTLHSVDDSIRAERNMRRLLTRVTGTMAERAGADFWAVYLMDQDGILRPEQVQGGDQHVYVAVPAFAQRVAQAAEPLRATPDEAEAFEWGDSAIGFPMRDEAGLVGVLILGHAAAGAFAEANMPLLALMASQAALGVRNARAYLYSEELAISDERTRIAREIHDGVAQSLAFCAIKLDVVARQIEKDPVRAEQEVREAGALLREQIQEVRRSIFALRPINLEKYGLLDTLRMYVHDFGEQNKLRTTLDVSGDVSLSKGDEAILFRILQESLNNVAKHAQAGSVSVALSGGLQWVQLRVQDDGQGFDPRQVSGRVSSAGGLGLTQMAERMQSRGGEYAVISEPGHGTLVEARLPQSEQG